MMSTMREVWFSFEGGPAFRGLTDDSEWNGFLNVRMTPAVRDRLANWLAPLPDVQEETVDELRALPVGDDGLVYMGGGWAAQEVPPPVRRGLARARRQRKSARATRARR